MHDQPETSSSPGGEPAAGHHYSIHLVRVDLSGGSTVEVDLLVGSRVAHAYFAVEHGGVILAGPRQPPTVRLVPMLVVLVDPRIELKERRRFVALPVGQAIAAEQELQLVAVVTTPDGGQVLALFEERIGAST